MSSKLANTGAISMKDKKKSSLKIDKNGNVDTNNLSTEIKDSLDFDLRYKQTDNMKKRAIRVAGCYDDFKNMVACAHLKTVSRKEVESLREVKKGWQKQHVRSNNVLYNPMEILNENKKNEIRNDKSGLLLIDGNLTSVKDGTFSKPQTAMEFERDWNRLGIVADMMIEEQQISGKNEHNKDTSVIDRDSVLNEQRILFLSKIGSKKAKRLLQNDVSIDTLEGMFDALAFEFKRRLAVVAERSTENEEEELSSGLGEGLGRAGVAVPPPETVFAMMEGAATVVTDGEEKKFDVTKWLAMITTFGDFKMLSSFLSKDRKGAIAEILAAEGAAAKTQEGEEQVVKLIALYK